MLFFTRQKRNGIALILVVSIMMVLSITAISFARVSLYEHTASNNYCAKVEAKLVAMAGFDRAIAEITENIRQGKSLNDLRALSTIKHIMLAYPNDSDNDLQQASLNGQHLSLAIHEGVSPTLPSTPPKLGNFSYSGIVGPGKYDKDGNFYALKIKDYSGRFNVNSHSSSNRLQSNTIVNHILISLAKYCHHTSQTVSEGDAIALANAIRPANNNEPKHYNSIEEIEQAIAGISVVSLDREKFLENLGVHSWVNTKTFGVYRDSQRLITRPPDYYQEQRAPVNINSVTEELVMALIANIKATIIRYNTSSISTIDDYSVDEDTSFDNEDTMNYAAEHLTLQFSTMTESNLRQLARNILYESYPDTRNIFQDRSQFERYLDVNKASLPLPSNSSSLPIEKWQQACLDALKSNFNPNVIDNFWNPNAPTKLIACKGDLFLNTSGHCEPYHTTEFSFLSLGGIAITSLGRITAANYTRTVATATVDAIINFGEIIGHTTQQDFHSTGTGTGWISFPTNMNPPVVAPPVNAVANNNGGGIEPKPNTPGTNFRYYYSSNHSTTARRAYPLASIPNMTSAPRSAMTPEQFGAKNLAHDGIISRALQYNSTRTTTRYFVTHAFSSNAFSRSDGAAEGENFRTNVIDSSNVANYTGSIGMYVKLAQDAGSTTNKGVPCGLLSVHGKSGINTSTEPCDFEEDEDYSNTYTNGKFHEGVQMYLYINSLGKLRLTRMCYAFTYHMEGGSVKKYGTVDKDDKDPSRAYPRKDIEVDVSNWKGNTWHYVVISWNDISGSLSIDVDGQEPDNNEFDDPSSYGVGFCILNEINPHDSFFINGFFRREKKAGGYFLFSNTVDYPGNATIDEVISKASTTASGTTPPARYPSCTPGDPLNPADSSIPSATYGNTLTMPADVPAGSYWGPVCWNSYPSLSEGTTVPPSGRSYIHIDIDHYSRYTVNSGKPIAQKLVTTSMNSADMSYTAGLYAVGNECPALISVSAVIIYPMPQIQYIKIE